MLSEMSSSELADWGRYFGEVPFTLPFYDWAFAGLNCTIMTALTGKENCSLTDFTLLNKENTNEMKAETMMTISEGMAGGIRYEPTNSRSHD
ncbi:MULTISPECIES: phage tail assembly protein T [Proteus]|nr:MULTISPECIES: phage tail assembly protein T [Proteus]MCO8052026.1 phage tail assembly protein T [Proteus penneri]